MKVYTHFFEDPNNEIIYRWRTLLQIGESWDIRGTIFMKNPGSSFTKGEDSLIEDTNVLDNLRIFDDDEFSKSSPWYEFSEDKTMTYVVELFEAYYRAHQKTLKGIIQIFNLFNIRDADIKKAQKAIEISKENDNENLLYTVDDDIKHIVSPVYIGWGDLWKSHRSNAEKIFNKVIEVSNNSSYLYNDIQANKFYHPQFLMNYGKNRSNSQLILSKFVNDGIVPLDIDNIIFLTNIQNTINSKGTIKKDTINKLINSEILSYEYFCKGKNGKYERENGIISVGLKIDNERNKYVLSILSNGNHPDKFIAKVQEICDESKLFNKDADFNFVADVGTDDSRIIDFFTLLLSKMKEYRETDLPE